MVHLLFVESNLILHRYTFFGTRDGQVVIRLSKLVGPDAIDNNDPEIGELDYRFHIFDKSKQFVLFRLGFLSTISVAFTPYLPPVSISLHSNQFTFRSLGLIARF